MHIEKLSLLHQELLQEKLKQTNNLLSEYSFNTLYLFRHVHEYEVIFDEEIFIKGKTRDGAYYLMPTSPLNSRSIDLYTNLFNESFLFPIPDEWLPLFNPHDYVIESKESDSDYLFRSTKLQTYPGRHLSKKRNQVKQLVNLYKIESRPLNTNTAADAQHILEEWLKESAQSISSTDYHSCLEAIKLWETLGLQGQIYYINNEASGFLLGEEKHACFIIHFAKGKKNIIGLYAYMYQFFAKTLNSSIEWINWEQDLGSSNLRQSKRSYLPDQMATKWRIHKK